MKLKGFTNLKLAELLESATNLFGNKKYQSKKEVENNLGLLISQGSMQNEYTYFMDNGRFLINFDPYKIKKDEIISFISKNSPASLKRI